MSGILCRVTPIQIRPLRQCSGHIIFNCFMADEYTPYRTIENLGLSLAWRGNSEALAHRIEDCFIFGETAVARH